MDFIKKEKKPLLFLMFVFFLGITFFWLKQGWIIIDTGRELYIPWQMLKGEVLYKDIFNIYGALSYQINALAYLVFGQKIETLYGLGVLNSFFIVLGLYYLSREFLNRIFSVLIVLFVMSTTIFSTTLFNFNLPYSYAIVYAFSSFLFSVLFLIKYVKRPRPLFAYLSSFFAGISFATKYEYILYPFLLAYVFCFLRPLRKKDLLKGIGFFLLTPIISFSILFLQGLTLHDCVQTILYVKKMAVAPSLIYFYKNNAGTYFNPKLVLLSFINFCIFSLYYFLLIGANILNEKYSPKPLRQIIPLLLLFVTFIFVFGSGIKGFGFFPILNLLLLLFFAKPIFENKPLFILMLCALIGSMKTFFLLDVYIYGAFVIPLLLLSIVAFILFYSETLKKKTVKRAIKHTLILLLVVYTAFIGLRQAYSTGLKGYLLKTEKGNLYADESVYTCYSGLINYINQNLKKTDRVVILPETPFVNFVTGRDSDNYYHSLIPMYFETFGEDHIIDHFKKTRPEYFVLNNRRTIDYGHVYICDDYAQKFCSYMKQNYDSVKIFKEGYYQMIVYKRKDLK